LNPFGRRFKENGYQLTGTAEAGIRARHTIQPGTLAERLEVPATLPIGLRVAPRVEFAQSAELARSEGGNAVDVRVPGSIFLVGGGPIFRDVSFMASMSLAPTPDVHHLTIGFHNLLWDAVNVRVGRLLLTDFARPVHRYLTRHADGPGQVHVGSNPVSLEGVHAGIDIYGRPGGGPLLYRLALVNGAQSGDGMDIDDFKDVYARVAWTFDDRHTLGMFSYVGSSALEVATGGIRALFDDLHVTGGLDLELALGPVTPYLQAAVGHHADPNGDGASVLWFSGRAEVAWSITPDLLALVGYAQTGSADDSALDAQSAVAHLTWLILTNLKLGVEYQLKIDDIDRSRGVVLLDLAL